MNMYASVFFLTAMSEAREQYLASALKGRRRRTHCSSARCVSVLIWFSAVSAALPHAVFSTTATVSNEDLCLVKFPETNGSAQFWLGLYHSQKVLLGFLVPLGVICVCYLLLLRFITNKNINTSSAKRRAKVTRSVTIVVLSFFLCWLPNQALTAWGILIKLNAVHFTYEYYTMQVFVFPVSVCLAHSNSCLNPILYSFLGETFRDKLRLFVKQKASWSVVNRFCHHGLDLHLPGAVIYNDRRDLPQNST
uniref:Relaxin/insulin-like family peptide receptor 3 n=1 Tax=Nothobranchius kadleci TaxID=1051664 RepID=A0A1A8BQS4_NOTKA